MNKKPPPRLPLPAEIEEDRHKPKGEWTHWTSAGVFRLKSDYVARHLMYELRFKDAFVANYFDWQSAVSDVLTGKLDASLGISGKDSGLPSSIYNWNKLK